MNNAQEHSIRCMKTLKVASPNKGIRQKQKKVPPIKLFDQSRHHAG